MPKTLPLKTLPLETLPPQTPHHTLTLDTHLGPLHLSVDLKLTAPWTVLFGPSGSGKSTLLRALCGLVPTISQPANQTPPHLRNIAWAPQNSTLFPHLTVRDNVAFSASILGQPDPERLASTLALFQLEPLAQRLPSQLSGGERQRVNLARAFAHPRPTLMLLDEPFNGIGRPLRDILLPGMKAHLAAHHIPTLSVTHDVEEAYLLNAEVLRIDNGKITARGSTPEVLHEERAVILKNLKD